MSRILQASIILVYIAGCIPAVFEFTKEGTDPLGALIGLGILAFVGLLVWVWSKPVARFLCQTIADFILWIADGFRGR
jgi:hypothetical protein